MWTLRDVGLIRRINQTSAPTPRHLVRHDGTSLEEGGPADYRGSGPREREEQCKGRNMSDVRARVKLKFAGAAGETQPCFKARALTESPK